jgi:anti-anti-sigma regulatory factor
VLKITQDAENAGIVRINLCGGFTAEYVPEVEKEIPQNDSKSKGFVLDLAKVTFVDRVAMEFLRAVKSRKVRIERPPSYVTRWIQQETVNGAHDPKPRNG